MKTTHTLLSLFLASTILFSCKDKEASTPANERMEENHPTEADNREAEEPDTLRVVQDSLIDKNMKGQSDTHGRDTDAGD